jgi:hypothetical protein
MNAPVVAATDSKYGLPTSFGMAPGLAVLFNDALYNRCIDVAQVMANARGITPPHLIGKTHSCFAVVTNAITWRLNPFHVGQCTYETPGGKVGYEGKLVQAILENSGSIVGGIEFEHYGPWEKIEGRFKEAVSGKGNKFFQADWKQEDERGVGVIVRAKVKGED